MIAADPPRVVHLITRAQGGLHDYEAFLHEAGHALHYAGCDPELPLSFRRLALTMPSRRSTPSCSTPSRTSRAGTRSTSGSPTRRRVRTPKARALRTTSCSAATPRSSASSSTSGCASRPTTARPTATRSGSRPRPGSATPPRTTWPTWTPASTPPTTCARGSALHSSAPISGRRWGRPGGVRLGQVCCSRPLPRGHPADDRGDRPEARLRATRHGAARRRADVGRVEHRGRAGGPAARASSPACRCRSRPASARRTAVTAGRACPSPFDEYGASLPPIPSPGPARAESMAPARAPGAARAVRRRRRAGRR